MRWCKNEPIVTDDRKKRDQVADSSGATTEGVKTCCGLWKDVLQHIPNLCNDDFVVLRGSAVARNIFSEEAGIFNAESCKARKKIWLSNTNLRMLY